MARLCDRTRRGHPSAFRRSATTAEHILAGDALLARRIAASLAIPVARRDLERLLDRIARPVAQDASLHEPNPTTNPSL
jgi:hypothetical protein